MTGRPISHPAPSAEIITRHELRRRLESVDWFDRMGSDLGLWVHVPEQRLRLIHRGTIVSAYSCSTAREGVGTREGSGRTPDGWHEVAQKIGGDLPAGAILRGRVWTGECWGPGTRVEGDLVLSRILWLSGLEQGHNRGEGVDSQDRFIYIHGTNAEDQLGRPVSHGCIRLANADVIDLYEQVSPGCRVLIR